MNGWQHGVETAGSKGASTINGNSRGSISDTAWQAAEKLYFAKTAPKGATKHERLTAPLKRCPDTNHEFFRNLLGRAFFLLLAHKVIAGRFGCSANWSITFVIFV